MWPVHTTVVSSQRRAVAVNCRRVCVVQAAAFYPHSMKAYARPRDDGLVSPAVEAARANTSLALTKQFSQQTSAARRQFVDFLVKNGSGNQSPKDGSTVTFGGGVDGSVRRGSGVRLATSLGMQM